LRPKEVTSVYLKLRWLETLTIQTRESSGTALRFAISSAITCLSRSESALAAAGNKTLSSRAM